MLVNKVFKPLMGNNIKVYVDNMIEKRKHEARHLAGLCETFAVLCNCDMKLNPNKCVFDVRSGKFLGFIISSYAIEASPDKVQAVLDIKPPQTIEDIP